MREYCALRINYDLAFNPNLILTIQYREIEREEIY